MTGYGSRWGRRGRLTALALALTQLTLAQAPAHGAELPLGPLQCWVEYSWTCEKPGDCRQTHDRRGSEFIFDTAKLTWADVARIGTMVGKGRSSTGAQLFELDDGRTLRLPERGAIMLGSPENALQLGCRRN